MTDIIDDEDENSANRKKTGKGETDGSFGDGKAGAGAGVGFRLTVNKDKQVKSERRILVGAELIEAFVEFCSESFVASVNAVVSFTKTANAKSYAVVNWVVDLQKAFARELALNRERTASATDARAPAQKKTTPGFGMSLGPRPTE